MPTKKGTWWSQHYKQLEDSKLKCKYCQKVYSKSTHVSLAIKHLFQTHNIEGDIEDGRHHWIWQHYKKVTQFTVECKNCKYFVKMDSNWRQMQLHLKFAHGINHENISSLWQYYIIKSFQKYQCILCHNTLEEEDNNLSDHLIIHKKKPPLGLRHDKREIQRWLRQYYTIFETYKVKCNICKKARSENDTNMRKHLKRRHKIITWSTTEENRKVQPEPSASSMMQPQNLQLSTDDIKADKDKLHDVERSSDALDEPSTISCLMMQPQNLQWLCTNDSEADKDMLHNELHNVERSSDSLNELSTSSCSIMEPQSPQSINISDFSDLNTEESYNIYITCRIAAAFIAMR